MIAQIVNNSNLKPCSHVFAVMQFLDERFEGMRTSKNKLNHPQSNNGAVKQRDLENFFKKLGKERLVGGPRKAPTTSKSTK